MPGRHPTHRTARRPALLLAACLLAVATLTAAPATAGTTNPAQPEPERRDNVMGTVHEGITMESAPGQDTILLVTPPPTPPEDTTDDTLPYGIQPDVKVNAKDYMKQ